MCSTCVLIVRFVLLPAEGATGGESHQRGVEVDVGGGAFGAGGVAGELVLVAGPGAVGDLLSDAGVEDDGELGGGAFDAVAELGRTPSPRVRRRPTWAA